MGKPKKYLQASQEMKKRLASVGPFFCLAPWTWLSLDLESGMTKTCPFSSAYKTSRRNVKKDPFEFHNSSKRKELRRKILGKLPPSECSHCWELEKNTSQNYSDRWLISSSTHSAPVFCQIRRSPHKTKIYPRILDLSLQGPSVSSNPQRTGFLSTNNPYRKSFWRWWPQLKKHLVLLQISGDDLTGSPEVRRIFDDICNGTPLKFQLHLKTSLTGSKVDWKYFLARSRILLTQKRIPSLRLNVSILSTKEQMEYFTSEKNYLQFCRRIHEFLGSTPPTASVWIDFQFQNLSIIGFQKLISFIGAIRHFHGRNRVFLCTQFPQNEDYQSLTIVPVHIKKKYLSALRLMRKYPFQKWEKEMAQSGLSLLQQKWPQNRLLNARIAFYRQHSSESRNSQLAFKQSFPEYSKFWIECKKLAEKPAHSRNWVKEKRQFTQKPFLLYSLPRSGSMLFYFIIQGYLEQNFQIQGLDEFLNLYYAKYKIDSNHKLITKILRPGEWSHDSLNEDKVQTRIRKRIEYLDNNRGRYFFKLLTGQASFENLIELSQKYEFIFLERLNCFEQFLSFATSRELNRFYAQKGSSLFIQPGSLEIRKQWIDELWQNYVEFTQMKTHLQPKRTLYYEEEVQKLNVKKTLRKLDLKEPFDIRSIYTPSIQNPGNKLDRFKNPEKVIQLYKESAFQKIFPIS